MSAISPADSFLAEKISGEQFSVVQLAAIHTFITGLLSSAEEGGKILTELAPAGIC